MTPGDFIAKWSDSNLRERAAAQSHFIDLCKVLGEQAPTDADPKGEWYAFEKGAMKGELFPHFVARVIDGPIGPLLGSDLP